MFNPLKFFQKDTVEVIEIKKMTVSELTDQYNSMIVPDDNELPSDEVLAELTKMFGAGFLSECGTVPEFDLDKYGRIINLKQE